jgi:hypothetical protein
VRWEGKGRRRRSSTGLNSSTGRRAREGEGAPSGGACHLWPRPSRLGAKERETAPLDRGWLIALIGKLDEEGKEGKEAGRGGIRGCGDRAARQRRRRKEGGEGETDEWGPGVSESKEKEKERGDVGRRGLKDGGLLGCLGRKVRR